MLIIMNKKSIKMNKETLLEINKIFSDNELEDLQTFIKKRKCLNTTNMTLIYLFHIMQAAGILTTTLAAGYNYRELIWVGIGFNVIAGLINTFEQINNAMSKRLLKDIIAIKEDRYIDESEIVDPSKDNLIGSKNINKQSENSEKNSDNDDLSNYALINQEGENKV